MEAIKRHKKELLLVVLLIGFLSSFQIFTAMAQEKGYPEKPIQIIIPFGPGGITDIALRFLASVIPQYIGQPVVVINKPGASGTIAFEYISRQTKPDGYTMMGATAGPNTIVPARNPKLPFKFDDLTFIARLQTSPMMLVVRNDSPFKTLSDMLDYIRKNPKKLKFSTAGLQTTQYLGPLVLLKSAKIPLDYVTAIHYDSGAEQNLALLRGDVDFCYNFAVMLTPLIKAEKLRGLLVPIKVKELPNVPTSQELGYPEANIIGWQGVAGTPKLPDYVVKKWTEAIKKTMDDKSWGKMVGDSGDVPAYLGPDEFRHFVTGEVKRYREIFKELGLLIE
ncbi:MAG: tripartite tricarboxylate transporter substrate binding protein [Nitrospirota bacterium]